MRRDDFYRIAQRLFSDKGELTFEEIRVELRACGKDGNYHGRAIKDAMYYMKKRDPKIIASLRVHNQEAKQRKSCSRPRKGTF